VREKYCWLAGGWKLVLKRCERKILGWRLLELPNRVIVYSALTSVMAFLNFWACFGPLVFQISKNQIHYSKARSQKNLEVETELPSTLSLPIVTNSYKNPEASRIHKNLMPALILMI